MKFKRANPGTYKAENNGHVYEIENTKIDTGKRGWIVRVDGEAVDAGSTRAEAELWARKAAGATDERQP